MVDVNVAFKFNMNEGFIREPNAVGINFKNVSEKIS